MPHTAHPKASVIFIRFILLGFITVLCLVSIANLGVFTPNWPFELFASFSRHLLVLAPLMGLLIFMFWRQQVWFFLIAALAAFWPLATFTKYENPTHDSCQQTQCLGILSANLRGRDKALNRLAKIAPEGNFDIIGIYELPYSITKNDLKALFPNYATHFIATKAPNGQNLGSIIALISRKQLSDIVVIPSNGSPDKFLPRAFIRADLSTNNGQIVSIYAGHPRLPLSKASMAQRAELLGTITHEIGDTKNFILMGDFNLTPWAPAFRKLPGKRAGDPRLIYTWDAERPWFGIPIDHILIGNGFELMDAEGLPTIGSDHRPISAVITLRE